MSLDLAITGQHLPEAHITKSGSVYTIAVGGIRDMVSRTPTTAEHSLGVPYRTHAIDAPESMIGPGAAQLSGLSLAGPSRLFFDITLPTGNATVSGYTTGAKTPTYLAAEGALVGNAGGVITLAEKNSSGYSGAVTIQASAIADTNPGNIMIAAVHAAINDSQIWPLELQGTNATTVVTNTLQVLNSIIAENMRRTMGRNLTVKELLMMSWRLNDFKGRMLRALAGAGELPEQGILHG